MAYCDIDSNIFKEKRAFTVLELLVVIAIITLISAFSLASLGGSRAKSRDVKRVRDFKEFNAGLELFYNTYGKYPCGDAFSGSIHIDSSWSCPFLDGDGSNPSHGSSISLPPICVHNPNPQCTVNPKFGLYRAELFPLYQPKDPIQTPTSDWGYLYTASLNLQKYLLQTRLEKNSELMANDGGLCANRYEFGTGLGDSALTIPNSPMFGIACN